MKRFKHYRTSAHRYNIYESYHEVETGSKEYYETLRNTLFLIALILSFSVTTLISYDNYQELMKTNSELILINPGEAYQDKENENKLRGKVSKIVVAQLASQNKLHTINGKQLTAIINNVMEKAKHSPNPIIYTQK